MMNKTLKYVLIIGGVGLLGFIIWVMISIPSLVNQSFENLFGG